MPQITVTPTDEMYWEVRQLAKGRVSAFINEAVRNAVASCGWEPAAYVKYAQGTGNGIELARSELKRIDEARAFGNVMDSRTHPNQTKLEVGEEE